jgi:hypothetical protein
VQKRIVLSLKRKWTQVLWRPFCIETLKLCIETELPSNVQRWWSLEKRSMLTRREYIPDKIWVGVTFNWRFIANNVFLATSPLRLTPNNFIFKLNTCGYIPYVTSSLTRRWVCRLLLLLVFASTVILRSESRGANGYILLSQILNSPNLELQVLVFISPTNRVSQLYSLILGSLFVAYYASQGYGGGIRPRL